MRTCKSKSLETKPGVRYWLGQFYEIFKYTTIEEGLNLALIERECFHLPKSQPHPNLVLSNMKKSFNRLSNMRKQIDMQYPQVDFKLHTDGSVKGTETKCHYNEAITL